MGVGQSTNSGAAYDKLKQHRETLYQRQLQHRQQCEETKRQAAQQLQLGNRTGALNLARQLKMLEAQEKTIAGIVTNLDAQKVSMEQQQIQAETMSVMTNAVRSMGRGALNVDAVEDALAANDDIAADLKEVADALSVPYSATDDEDDLLSGLLASVTVASEAEQVHKSNDDTFIEYMRAAAVNSDLPLPGLPVLPNAPSHDMGGSGSAPSLLEPAQDARQQPTASLVM